MRKLIGSTLVVLLGLAVLPTLLTAQRRGAAPTGGAKHEFGVDIGVAYTKPENVSGGITIGTPLDVRVGFMSRTKVMWEPHVTLNFSTVGGSTTYLFTPGVNVLYSMTPGGHRNGMFLTGGAGLVIGDNGVSSGTAFSLGGAVGWRKPYGTAAWRYELGFQYTSSSTKLGLPSTIQIGGRIGLSLWH
jgi:hypothetical protein